jgi:two-component system response regulator YesN
MLKILIVDDEVLVRVGIKSVINWDDLNMELIGEASNGKEAWEMIAVKRPDIVLLDIIMPEMDGIELLKKIKEAGIHTKVLILSCHDEFAYVRQAMQLGAVDYILKLTIEPKEICEIMKKIADSIMAEGHVTGEPTKNLLKEYILYLISGKSSEGVIYTNDEISGFRKRLAEYDNVLIYLSFAKDKLVRMNFVENIFREVLKDFSREDTSSFITTLNDYSMIGILSCPGCEPLSSKIAERLKAVLGVYLNMPFRIVVSRCFRGEEGMDHVFRDTERALLTGFYYPDRYVFYVSQDVSVMNTGSMYSKDEMTKIYSCIELNDEVTCMELINHELEAVEKEKALHPYSVKSEIITIVNLCIDYFKKHDSDKLFLLENDQDYYSCIMEMEYLQQMKEWIRQFIRDYFSAVRRLRVGKHQEEINKVKKYVQENYNKKLDLSGMARLANMSVNYFSYVFKEETGENLVDYINHIRIKRAKEYMSTGKYKVYEIAEMVGYNSSSYFSRIYKKITAETIEDSQQSV